MTKVLLEITKGGLINYAAATKDCEITIIEYNSNTPEVIYPDRIINENKFQDFIKEYDKD